MKRKHSAPKASRISVPVAARQVNLYDAKTHLSELVEDAAAGDEIVIAKAGEAKARLVPLVAARPSRKPGGWKGQVRISDGFDAPLPDDILAAFHGEIPPGTEPLADDT